MTKIRKRTNKVFIFLFLALSFGICLTMADMFSSMIAVGGFNFTSNAVTVQSFSLYAISVNDATTNALAEDMSATTKDQGGAGYIYLDGNNYYILASLYENLSDAEKVKSNILSQKSNAQIITLQFDALRFDNSLESQEKETLTSALNIFKSTYKKLYDLAVSLDTNVKSEVAAKLEVNTIKNSVSKIKNDFSTIFKDTKDTDLLNIKSSIQKLETSLTSLMENNSTDYSYSTYVKYEYINDMMIYKDLCDIIVKK